MRGRGAIVPLWILVLLVAVGLGVQGYAGVKTLRTMEAILYTVQAPTVPQAQTVAYHTGEQQGSFYDVQYYDAPAPGAATTSRVLPKFTPVEMVCWVDTDNDRWFYVRVSADSPVLARKTVVVRASDVHNQTHAVAC